MGERLTLLRDGRVRLSCPGPVARVHSKSSNGAQDFIILKVPSHLAKTAMGMYERVPSRFIVFLVLSPDYLGRIEAERVCEFPVSFRKRSGK